MCMQQWLKHRFFSRLHNSETNSIVYKTSMRAKMEGKHSCSGGKWTSAGQGVIVGAFRCPAPTPSFTGLPTGKILSSRKASWNPTYRWFPLEKLQTFQSWQLCTVGHLAQRASKSSWLQSKCLVRRDTEEKEREWRGVVERETAGLATPGSWYTDRQAHTSAQWNKMDCNKAT